MARHVSPWPMISIEEATETALSLVAPLLPSTFPLGSLLGRVLCEDVFSCETIPAVPTSIVDGYAVVSSDGAGEFDVVGGSRAGGAKTEAISPGKVCYITTGAPLPEGADAVVMVEDTEKLSEVRVRINKASKSRGMIREIGSDIQAEAQVLSKGDIVGPAEIGLLATVGVVEAKARAQPVVAIMSTGDELAEPDHRGPLAPGVIRDSNRAMLIAACEAEGARVIDLGIARDEAGSIEDLLDQAIAQGADLLVTSGGVSMGDRDLVKPLLEKRGKIHFGRVLMKPGKPLTCATIPTASRLDKPSLVVFGLPGNPVSSLVTFHLVVNPCIRKLKGYSDPHLRRVRALTSSPMALDPERPEYHRVMLKWDDAFQGLIALSTGGQRSSRLLSMRSANALLELPQASGILPAGSMVSALIIGELTNSDLRSNITIPFPPPDATSSGQPQIQYSGKAAKPKVGVITISDRASTGVYEDISGPMIIEVLKEFLTSECEFVRRVIPDEVLLIASAIKEFAAAGCCLICTTGGTGPSPRDVTPEAMHQVCEKIYDGFGESMRRTSLEQGVPTAILSRQMAGSVGKSLVVNLPGKPGSVRTCLGAIFPAIPYCIDLLGGSYLEGKDVFRPPAKK